MCRAAPKSGTRRDGREGGRRPSEQSEQRTRRLEVLIGLRKLYRNFLRAQGLLAQPSPIYLSDTYGPGVQIKPMMGCSRPEHHSAFKPHPAQCISFPVNSF